MAMSWSGPGGIRTIVEPVDQNTDSIRGEMCSDANPLLASERHLNLANLITQSGHDILMQLLYLDASGDPGWCPPHGKSATTWYVLAGLSLNEEKWTSAHQQVDSLMQSYFGSRNISCREFRYSSLIPAAPPYDTLTPAERRNLADDIFELIRGLSPILFASAIHKNSHREKYGLNAISPKIWSLQLIAPRFDKFLSRTGSKGIMIMDQEETRKDRKLRELIQEARKRGIVLQSSILPDPFRTDTKLPNLVESVMFVNSEDSPVIQLVDFCAHAVWNHFERNLSDRFNEIHHLFDSVGGSIYGLKVWQPQ
jgi:hypothetical protein